MELMPMPPMISLISWVQPVIRFTSRSRASSGFRRRVSSGRWVQMPQLQLPVWQLWHMWQPMAMRAAVPMATASAPRAMALTMSALLRMVPLATRPTWLRMPSSRRRLSTAARASSMGMPTLSRVWVGAAPVPARRPSMTMISAPERAMPLAMAATLWTAAIFTRMGFS